MYEAKQRKKVINRVIGKEYINAQKSQVNAIQRQTYYRYMNKEEAQIAHLETTPPKWIGDNETCINSRGDKNHAHVKKFDKKLDLSRQQYIKQIEGDDQISDNVIGVKTSEKGNYGLGKNMITFFNQNIRGEEVWHKVSKKSSNSTSMGGMNFVKGISRK